MQSSHKFSNLLYISSTATSHSFKPIIVEGILKSVNSLFITIFKVLRLDGARADDDVDAELMKRNDEKFDVLSFVSLLYLVICL